MFRKLSEVISEFCLSDYIIIFFRRKEDKIKKHKLLDLKGGFRKADTLGTELAGGLNGLIGVVLFFITGLVDGTDSSGSCLIPSEVRFGFLTSHSIGLTFTSDENKNE